MPFNITKTASWVETEILKFPTGLHQIKSIVLDATDLASWTVATDGSRTVAPAGTILKLSATNTNQYVKYNGTGTIKGILGRPVDILANVTAGSEPAPMFFNGAIFATTAIVGFTQYASALVADLSKCSFE